MPSKRQLQHRCCRRPISGGAGQPGRPTSSQRRKRPLAMDPVDCPAGLRPAQTPASPRGPAWERAAAALGPDRGARRGTRAVSSHFEGAPRSARCFRVPAVTGHWAQRDAVPLRHRAARPMAPGVWSLRPGTLSGELRQLEPRSWGRALGGGDVRAGAAGPPCWLPRERSASSLLPHTWQGRAAWEARGALRQPPREHVLFPGHGRQDRLAGGVVQPVQEVPSV